MKPGPAILKTVCGVCLCLALYASPSPSPAQTGESKVYTVAKLSVDVSASDAVAAKTQALAQAKLQALHTVFRRIAPFNSFHRLPAVGADAVDDLLDGISVRKERNSATRYLATLDFAFNPEQVRKLLSSKGLPVSDQQGEPVTVVPVYIDKGKIDHTGRDPWRAAWNGLDLEHAVVPVKLGRAPPAFTMESLSDVMDGDAEAYVALRDRHKSKKLVLAVAEPAAEGATLTTRLFGIDPVGSVSLTRNDPVRGGDASSAAAHAARISLGILEGRWKLVHLPVAAEGGDAPPVGIGVLVEFDGMSQWKDIRARLVKVPGVNGLDVKSLSARTAQVTFEFPGGADRLAQALSSHGLFLHGGNGAWILRSN